VMQFNNSQVLNYSIESDIYLSLSNEKGDKKFMKHNFYTKNEQYFIYKKWFQHLAFFKVVHSSFVTYLPKQCLSH
jgi:hypothetical protein